MKTGDGLAYVEASASELRRHRASLGRESDPSSAELRGEMQHPDTLHIQVWWTNVPSRLADSFLWDAFDIENVQADQVASLLSALARRGELQLSGVAPNPLVWESAADLGLFSIQPQRFRAFHPMGKPMAQAAYSGASGFTMELMDKAANAYLQAQREEVKQTCLRWTVNRGDRYFHDATQLAAFYADFVGRGKNIFSFPQHLTEMFARTDVNDIPLDLIKLPYDCIYLSFDAQAGLEVAPGWLADGAYVASIGGPENRVIQFAMTAVPVDWDWYPRWMEHPEPVYIQAITRERMSMGVGEAVELVHAEHLAKLRREISRPVAEVSAGMIDATSRHAAAELQGIAKKHEAWGAILKLVVNGLAYISGYPDDIERGWPEGAPADLIAQLKAGKFKQQRAAASQLANLGFSEINLCGKHIGRQHLSSSGIPGEGDKVITWVKGHWLRQFYGEGRALRKLQWRMPVLRNADAVDSGEEVKGHIYRVDD